MNPKSKHKLQSRSKGLALSITGLIVSFLFLFPYLSMFSTALKPNSSNTEIPPTYLPTEYQWDNFIKVFQELPFGMYLRNTIIISLCTMILGLLASIPAGYYIARNKFRGRTAFLLLVLITQMFSPTALLIGIYREMSILHLINGRGTAEATRLYRQEKLYRENNLNINFFPEEKKWVLH